jgi:hypothetical protein
MPARVKRRWWLLFNLEWLIFHSCRLRG